MTYYYSLLILQVYIRIAKEATLFDRLKTQLNERFSKTWVLLSDTDRFISRAGLLPRYESQLREWRNALQDAGSDPIRIRDIREEIITFRQHRRLEGWELRLGFLDIQLKGFRSDDAMGIGFNRMVMTLGGNGEIYFITGSANHVELDRELSQKLQKNIILRQPIETHYLWYRRSEGIIELAGADSQSKDSHEHLKEYIEKNKSGLVKALYKLV